jgi:hypothetical protein
MTGAVLACGLVNYLPDLVFEGDRFNVLDNIIQAVE